MPRRMRSTFGNVQRIDRDHYRLRWWELIGGEYKRRSETVRGTRREAERRLAEIRASLDETARGPRRAVPTVGECYERWALPSMLRQVEEGRCAASTQRMRESSWRTAVAPRWAGVKVTDVRALDIQRWLDSMTEKPAVRALALLRAVLDQAALYEAVEVNVARRAYTMPRAHADSKDGAYSLRELDRIAQAAQGMPCEAAMLLMMFGSARAGESLGVKAEEVYQLEAHGVRMAVAPIVRQMGNDGRVTDHLKTAQSARPLIVPEPWGLRVVELAAEALGRSEVWLCDRGDGTPIKQERLRAYWAKACETAGVEPKQPRAARRSWETYMRWDMGVEQSRIEQMMGHTLGGVTGAHYDKPTAQLFADAVGGAFSRKPFMR